MGNPLIRVKNLKVVLSGRTIIEKISFTVSKGEIFGIIGISGAGKTTLLAAMVGYLPTMQGDVKLLFRKEGKERCVSIYPNLSKAKRIIGFASQNSSFYPELTVEENLRYFADLYGLKENVANLNIPRVMHLVGLSDQRAVKGSELSFGMQKRLDIACAMVHNPPILFLDEPTADLDPLLRRQVWNLVRKINARGTTIVLASHFLEDVEYLCDRIAILHNKAIVASGTPDEIRSSKRATQEIHIVSGGGEYKLIIEELKKLKFAEIEGWREEAGKLIVLSPKSEKIVNYLLKGAKARRIASIELKEQSMERIFEEIVK